jgi:segregation and condensation protein B
VTRTPRVKKASPRPRGVPPQAAAPESTPEPDSIGGDEPDIAAAPAPEPRADEPPQDDPPMPPDEPAQDDPETQAEKTDLTEEERSLFTAHLPPEIEPARLLPRAHLRGLLEALVFASDKPMTAHELAKLASAPLKDVKELLGELRETYAHRGITLGEIAGGWLFRTNAQFAPFVRELTGERPVRLSRAQLETLAIAAYRQPITRPEIDEIRGVDSGATMKLLLERELLRILGKKDEPGRPLLYGTTPAFLEFFGLKSLKELPTLREFAELSDESRAVAEAELGEVVPRAPAPAAEPEAAPDAPPDAALLADVPSEESRPAQDGEDGTPAYADDAALADVDVPPATDDTTITDPDRVLGGDE